MLENRRIVIGGALGTIFKPVRGTASTDHSGTTAQIIASFELVDDTQENLEIVLNGRDSTGDKRVSYTLDVQATRKVDAGDDYNVNEGSQSFMNQEDEDLNVEVVANGDANVLIRAKHEVGSAGTWEWDFMIQKKVEQLLS